MTIFSVTANPILVNITLGTPYSLSSLFTVTPGNDPLTGASVVAAVGFISPSLGYTISGGSLNPFGTYEEALYGDVSDYYGTFPANLTVTFLSYPAAISFLVNATSIEPGVGPFADGSGDISGQFSFSPSSALFTSGADAVKFDSLTTDQQAAVNGGADLYNALGGGDTITLPNAGPTDTSVPLAGTTKTFDLTKTFVLGDKVGDTTTVTGGNGSYNLALGAGSDTVTVNGNGNSNITAGTGSDTINIQGTGTNKLTIGAGTVTLANWSGTLIIENGSTIAAPNFDVADLNGSVSNVTATKSSFQISGPFTIGDGGDGTLSVQNGTTISATDFDLGFQKGSVGKTSLDSSKLTISGPLTVGDAGFGSLTVQNGTTISATDLDVGFKAGSDGDANFDNSELNISGPITVGDGGSGTLIVQNSLGTIFAPSVDIAFQAKSTGFATFDHSTFNISGPFTVGDSGSGGLTIRNGSVVSAPNIVIANSTGSNGTLVLDHSEVDTPTGALVAGNSAQGVLAVQNGSTINAEFVNVGRLSGSAGSEIILDNSTATITGSVNVGIGDSATLLIQNGAIIAAPVVHIGSRGTLELGIEGSTGNSPIQFVGSGGTLQIDSTTMPAGTIIGLAAGDKIDLKGVAFNTDGGTTLTGNVLHIVEGSASYDLQTAGDLNGNFFEATNDGSGGTLLTLIKVPSFTVQTASPGTGDYTNSIVATEGVDPGQLKITLSSAVDVPIAVHVDLQPDGWQQDVSLRDFIIPAGVTTYTAPVLSAAVDSVPEPIESGNLVVTATAQSTSLTPDGSDPVPVAVNDHVTSADGQLGIADGIKAFQAAINSFKATVDVTLAFDPDNPAVVNIKSNLEIIGKALDGAEIALNFQNLSSLPEASFSDGVKLIYTDVVNTVVDTFSTFYLKPATVAIASLTAYEAGLGVGMLAQSLGTEAAVAAALAGDGALTLTLGLGIASATTVAVAAAPFLIAAGAGWAAEVAYDDLSTESKNELKDLLLGLGTTVGNGFQQAFDLIANPKPVQLDVDGYISGATVFSDDNGNAQLNSGEISATTDATGGFILSGGAGPLIALGGIDKSTDLPFKGQMSAPEGSSVITPLTTLLTSLPSNPSAQSTILSALGLSSSLHLTTFDPIAAAQAGSTDGAATEVAGAKVYDTVEMIASALAGAGGTSSHILQDTFAALASTLDGAGLDLSDKNALSTLISQVAKTEGVTLASGVADSIASIIAAGNTALDHVLQTDQPGAQLLSDAAGVELVEQGAASTAITQAAGSLAQLQAIANLFTGANFDHLITQAQAETQNPGQDLGPIAFDGSATTNQNTVLNGTVSAVDLAGHSITYAIDGTTPAGLTFNPDGTFKFAPGSAYKYLGVGESTSLSFQFTASDGEGTDSTARETITINGLNDNPTAMPDSNGVAKGNKISVSAAHGVLANDSDPDIHDQLAVGSVNGSAANVGHSVQGTYGTLTLNADGSYSYSETAKALPSQTFAQDNFTYATVDGHGGSATSTLTFVVFDPSASYQAGSNTTLSGGNGKSVLDGSAGHDPVLGGNGPDVLIGGNGDTMTGGNGPDQFVFRPNFGANIITDFDVKNENIQFDKSIFASVGDILSHTADSAHGAIISDGHGDTVTLTGVTLAQIQAHQSDLHLV